MKNKLYEELLNTLKNRFIQNINRHTTIDWTSVEVKLKNSNKLHILEKMESTGGEPDVIGYDENTQEYIFCDCSSESPGGRRSLCFDQKARNSRKKNKPITSAIEMATLIGIEILTEEQYRTLQANNEYDKKTSSWIQTPNNIRNLGGALFCDRRYNEIFVYHNGAESYYSTRGFRGLLKV